jgi:hypothetical protein
MGSGPEFEKRSVTLGSALTPNLLLTPTQLSTYLACTHYTQLERRCRALNTAIDEVQRHVHDQPNTNQTGRRQDCQNRVQRDSRRGVKWMESDAAAVGVVNWVGEHMVEVYEHRS